MSETIEARLLVDSRCTLAEGVQWRADEGRLYWTDIHGAALWSAGPEGEDPERWDAPERIGSFAFDPEGAMLAAMESGLFRIDAARQRIERLTRFEADKPTTRLNDGRCDRQGRFLAGGIDEADLAPLSSVIRYDGGAAETVIDGVGCANSICFSPDGRLLYFADTPSRRIRRYPYDPQSGALGPAEIFAEIAEGEGFPDGACVDSQGALWSARYAGARVQRLLPDGAPERRIALPVPNVTCCCFGGPALDRLYITTARENMTAEALAAAPQSGGIFVADPGVSGLEETRFAARLYQEPIKP